MTGAACARPGINQDGTAPAAVANNLVIGALTAHTATDAVDRIIDESYAMERYIDAQSGGPGLGWFRVVHTPAEARTVIAAGKLAVVLGIAIWLFARRQRIDRVQRAWLRFEGWAVENGASWPLGRTTLALCRRRG